MKTMKKTNGRKVEEQRKHHGKRSTMNTDKDREYADKVIEHEICASSGNTKKSSPRYDILCDVAQCQVDVAMFQETQNWHHEDAAAAEVGWSFFHFVQEERRQLPWGRTWISWDTLAEVQDGHPLCWKTSSFSLYFASHVVWRTGPWVPQDYEEGMQDIKQEFQIYGIIAGMGAQDEVKSHKEPFVGVGKRMYRRNDWKYRETVSKFENLFMEWITKHDVKLSDILFPKDGSLQERRQRSLIFGNRMRLSFRSGRPSITLRLPSTAVLVERWQGI